MRAIHAPHAFDGSRFLSDGATVVYDGERIVGVEPGRPALPEGIELAEYPGTVLPGLIDGHTHLVADATVGGLERAGTMGEEELDGVIASSLRAHAAAGVTTVRDLGDRGYRTLGFRNRSGLPRVVASGPPLTTPDGHCAFLGGVVQGSVEPAVAEHVERGVDLIKVMASGGFATPGSDQLGAQFSVAEITRVVEQAHRNGLPVVAHAHSLVGMHNALAAGVDGIEHFSGLTAQGPRIDDELLVEVADRGVHVDLTMGNDRSLHAHFPAPPPPVAALMSKMGVTSFDEFYATRFEVLTRLRAHGVAVITGVDSGMAPAKQHGNAWRTVGELVEAGYDAAAALAAATSVVATACGLGAETGRLAPGYAADILVVDGDLSADASLLGKPRLVVLRGTVAEPAASEDLGRPDVRR